MNPGHHVILDLTCWTRGPFTGVGLSAYQSFRALRRITTDGNSSFTIQGIARDRRSWHRSAASHETRYWGPLHALAGTRGIFHGFETSLAPALRSVKIMTVHDLWTLRENPYQASEFQERQAAKMKRAIDRADYFTTPTEVVRQELIRWLPSAEARTTVVAWAPLLESDESAMPEPLVEEYLDECRPFFLTVACLETRKNLPTLFQALRANPQVDLVLVGSPGYGVERVMSELQKLKDSGTRCIPFAHLNPASLTRLYQDCLALVQPSLDEGFGMPVVDSMPFGKPLILSDIPPFREIAGDAALFFPVAEPEALRELLKRVAEEPGLRRQQGQIAQDRAKLFSWEKTAQKLLEVYTRAAR